MLAMTKGAIYICMSSSELHTLFRAFTDAGGHWSTFVIWAKHHFTLGRSDYQRMYEPILYGWRDGTQHFWCGDRNQGDVWFIKRPMANLEHPTMKPVELVERALRNSSKTRDTILDPFGGSGTTLIACEKSSRQARVVELDPKYCDVIVRRWQDYTGGKVLGGGGGFYLVGRGNKRRRVETGGCQEGGAEEGGVPGGNPDLRGVGWAFGGGLGGEGLKKRATPPAARRRLAISAGPLLVKRVTFRDVAGVPAVLILEEVVFSLVAEAGGV